MKVNTRKNNALVFFILISMILPLINLMGFDIPVSYFFTPIGFFILFFVMIGKVKIPKIVKTLIGFSFIIIIQILLSGSIMSIKNIGYFEFPTDIMQYIVRFTFFFGFAVVAYKGKLDSDKFIKYFLITLFVGMAIGLLQWMPWPGREFFVRMYPFQDGTSQISSLGRNLSRLRVHGFAQMATANGGIASFSFTFAYSVWKYYDKYKIFSLMLIFLSLLNIVISQSRVGLVTVIFSIFLLYLINAKYDHKKLKNTLIFLLIILSFGLIIIYLYKVGNEFVLQSYYRWTTLFETGGGARATSQPQYFFSMMENIDYIFGLSKPAVNQSLLTYGVEIEPINIFITYGIIGFILQYSLVLILLIYFFKKIKNSVKNKDMLTLLVSSLVGLAGYQVFSIAYFFFREIRIGLFPWVLMGITIGLYERYKYLNVKESD